MGYTMRNEVKIEKILELTKNLPYFTLDDLACVEKNKSYLKTLFSRREKSGDLIRLKKGLYVNSRYLSDNFNYRDFYPELLANVLYQPSYLSLDYILYQYNLIAEIPVNFTSVGKNKTASFHNKFGKFFYHKVKDELFTGFDMIKKDDFTILKATKAKALFDFLYLRKNILSDKKSIKELRLNLDNFNKKEKKEFKKYIEIEGSKKMKNIFEKIWN